MSLTETIRARMKEAMKARKNVEKEILRVCIGEITTEEARSGEAMSDAQVEKILRKLLKSNLETLKSTEDEAGKAAIEEENAVLESLLPKQLSEDEIIAALEPVADAIKGAPGDGPATGIAMKHLKQSGAAVDGKTVSGAVRKLRG
jgi:uncharacterized protein YqeY